MKTILKSLSLPRETLILELERVLQDSIERFKYYVVEQVCYHQPERKQELVGWLREQLRYFDSSKLDDNVIDPSTPFDTLILRKMIGHV